MYYSEIRSCVNVSFFVCGFNPNSPATQTASRAARRPSPCCRRCCRHRPHRTAPPTARSPCTGYGRQPDPTYGNVNYECTRGTLKASVADLIKSSGSDQKICHKTRKKSNNLNLYFWKIYILKNKTNKFWIRNKKIWIKRKNLNVYKTNYEKKC